MDNSKDNKLYIGQDNLPETKSQNGAPIYTFLTKKTEKLVTALYMVTDCMDSDDALKNKLRSLGVELLSDIYKLSNLSLIEKNPHLSVSIAKINEAISFLDMSSIIGFISEMNAGILKREFNTLISELESHLAEKQQLSFMLDENMFHVEKPAPDLYKTRETSQGWSLLDKYGYSKGQGNIKDKRTFNNGQKDKSFTIKSTQDKQERTTKILSLIKEKGDLSTGQAGISIKDISSQFIDCSEKTIQRELNALVLKGELKKTGSKRWSRYSLSV